MRKNFSEVVARQHKVVKEQECMSKDVEVRAKKTVERAKKARREADAVQGSAIKLLKEQRSNLKD
jgi:hypothetical protein